MKTRFASIVFLLIICLISAGAEEHKTNQSGDGTTQIATTSDGRKVILNSDGTWKYYSEPAPEPVKQTPPVPAELPIVEPSKETLTPPTPVPVPAPTEPTAPVTTHSETPPATPTPENTSPAIAMPMETQKGTLSFEAVIASKPIAGGTFCLLNEDLNNILQASGLKPQKGLSLLNTFSMANYGATLGVERSVKTHDQAMESIKSHIIATTTSDPNGKGEFSSVNAGTYYLMHTGIVFMNTGSLNDRKAILWNLRVQIKPGQNAITLDEKNTVP